MPVDAKLRIKAVFPARRTRPLAGIPPDESRRAACRGEAVRWFNGRASSRMRSPGNSCGI